MRGPRRPSVAHCLALTCWLWACSSDPAPGVVVLAGGAPTAVDGGFVGTAAGASSSAVGGASSGGAQAGASGNIAGSRSGGESGENGGSVGSGGATSHGGSGDGGVSGAATAGAGGGSAGAVFVDPSTLPSITLHLAGDSTVMTYDAGSAQEGWGQELRPHFIAKLSIDNQAQGGASVETFYGGRWKNIVSALHAGDYVMSAFGANDSGTVAGRHVEPADFRARFAVMAEEVNAKQATFIIVTPSALQQWSGGKEQNTRLEPYVTVLHDLAKSAALPLVDLNARSLDLLNQVGQAAAQDIYIDGDKAHFTKQGATQMAELVVRELSAIQSPLAAYLQ